LPPCLSGKVKNEWSYISFHEQGKLYVCHALHSLNEQAFLCLLWLHNFLFRYVLIKSSVSYFLMEEAKQKLSVSTLITVSKMLIVNIF
jgi:hypothetical protein